MKSKDTHFAAVKLPKCLEGPHITCDKSTNSNRMHHRSSSNSRDEHSSTHDTREGSTQKCGFKSTRLACQLHQERTQIVQAGGGPRTVEETLSCSTGTGTWPVELLQGGCRKQLADMQPPLQPRFRVQYNRVFTTMWLQLNHVLEKKPLSGLILSGLIRQDMLCLIFSGIQRNALYRQGP